ncbi:hypothetical protein AOQ84DRAFT_98649 [Glonium stellatum]|uniref:Uncharacterized protein n=1 Tax=Glonium stellatum TaxID=574774 RepID=A0A8E2EUX1_9PEZI|nr:hypothetical protein AOQ84DRAFT_98649 [Glonium stellatum]
MQRVGLLGFGLGFFLMEFLRVGWDGMGRAMGLHGTGEPGWLGWIGLACSGTLGLTPSRRAYSGSPSSISSERAGK